MTYWNPVLRYGVDAFARDLAAAGGLGLITPDLIPDEADDWLAASERASVWTGSSWSRRRRRRSDWRDRRSVARIRLRGLDDGRHRCARRGVAVPHRNWCARVRAVSDIPVGVGLGVRSRRAGRRDRQLRRRCHRRVGAGHRAGRRPGRGCGADRGTGCRCASKGFTAMTLDWLTYFPSPAAGCLAPGPGSAPGLRAVHHRRHRRRPADRRPALGGPRRRAGRHLRHRAVGGAVRADRRPPLPRDDRLANLLRPTAASGWAHAADLGRRSGHLGCGRARRCRRLDRLPPSRDSAAGLRRCRRARNRAGAGDRPDRQLLQPGALRPARPTLPWGLEIF